MTTTTKPLSTLMPELRDILELPADLDLPRLYRITCTAYDGGGWTVDAMLAHANQTDLDVWEGLRAWASGTEPELDKPKAASWTTSGMARKGWVTVVVAEVSVTIWAHLDGLFTPPASVPVHVTGSFAELLLGGETR